MCSVSYPIVKRNFSFDCNLPTFIYIIPFYGLCISKYEVNYQNLSQAENDFVLLHYGTCVKRFIDYLIETLCDLQEEDFISLCGKVKISQVKPPQAECWSFKIQKKKEDSYEDILIISERKIVRNLFKKIQECFLHGIFPQVLTRLVVKKFVEIYTELTQNQDIGLFKNLDQLVQYDMFNKTLDTFKHSPQRHLFKSADYYYDEFTANLHHIVVNQSILDFDLPPAKKPSSLPSGKKATKPLNKTPSAAATTLSVSKASSADAVASSTNQANAIQNPSTVAVHQYSNIYTGLYYQQNSGVPDEILNPN